MKGTFLVHARFPPSYFSIGNFNIFFLRNNNKHEHGYIRKWNLFNKFLTLIKILFQLILIL